MLTLKKPTPVTHFKPGLWDAVRNGNKVILPQKTIVVGHVVEAQPRTKDNPESKLTIAFDKAVLKDGSDLPLRGVVARVQLSLAVAAAADAAPIRTTPASLLEAPPTVPCRRSPHDREKAEIRTNCSLAPTNIRDTTILCEADASGVLTVFRSATKADVKL